MYVCGRKDAFLELCFRAVLLDGGGAHSSLNTNETGDTHVCVIAPEIFITSY